MSDVSDMLYEFYRANVAKAPKSQQQQSLVINKCGQTSPTSAETLEPSTIAAIATNGAAVAAEELTRAAAIPTTAIAAATPLPLLPTMQKTASKNLRSDEMVSQQQQQQQQHDQEQSVKTPVVAKLVESTSTGSNAPFHPRIKYTNKSAGEGVHIGLVTINPKIDPATPPLVMTSIPTSVVVPTAAQIDVKPIIHPTTGLVISPTTAAATASVIKPVPAAVGAGAIAPIGTAGGVVADVSGVVPQAAVIAAALLRDGYHSFQQQMRAQEILKHQQTGTSRRSSQAQQDQDTKTIPTKILENFLRQQRDHGKSECDNDPLGTASDTNDGDDEEDDSRYNGFDDIHLMEGATKSNYSASSLSNMYQSGGGAGVFHSTPGGAVDYMSDESQKFMIAAQAQAQAFRSLDYTLGDFGTPGMGPNGTLNGSIGLDGEPTYECRHCGKKYRWKSTLRRHENVECGGKEPSHQCPYCPYKSKQRGNLGVHVRKHHSNLPQLASKRRSKYSMKLEMSVNGGDNASDDSSSKLIIDCPKVE